MPGAEVGVAGTIPVPADVVDRPLLDRFEGATRKRVVLLVAPAGYGKSVLVAQWRRAHPERRVLVVPARATDDAVRFGRRLLRTLEAAIPGAEDRVAGPMALDGMAMGEGVSEAVLAELARLAPVTLVIEDLENLSNPVLLDELGEMAERAVRCAAVVGLAFAPGHVAAIAGCEPGAVGRLRAALDERANLGPLWSAGRALFRTDKATHVAGDFNGWSQTALTSAAVCNTDLFVAVGPVAKGYWAYKLFDGQTWSLDPQNPAFAYDDFSGNLDGKNSVLNTPGSGKGHLVKLARACSSALGNCREVTAYYPRDYTAKPETGATTYPVLFMHDGQNLWDDHDCCFNHTGWEINVALDAEIAAGRVAPVIVIGAARTTSRNNEYGLSPTAMAAFMKYQVEEPHPQALAKVRWDPGKAAVAGSSLGGLVSMHLALAYPQTYGAAASLSGAFWPGQDQGFALRDKLPVYGKQALAVYVDSGGNVAPDPVQRGAELDERGRQLAHWRPGVGADADWLPCAAGQADVALPAPGPADRRQAAGADPRRRAG